MKSITVKIPLSIATCLDSEGQLNPSFLSSFITPPSFMSNTNVIELFLFNSSIPHIRKEGTEVYTPIPSDFYFSSFISNVINETDRFSFCRITSSGTSK